VESCVGVLVIVLFAVWYAFRPEGLFIDRPVEEGMPTAKGGASLEPVASGYSMAWRIPQTALRLFTQLGTETVFFVSPTSGRRRAHVHVYMVAADDAIDNATVRRAGFIDLGPIKGMLATKTTPRTWRQLIQVPCRFVWCQRFSLNFGTAPLTTDRITSRK